MRIFYRSRKGQTASSAATLVVLIAGMILLYILFLPAAEREALLQDDYTYSSGTSGSDGTSSAGSGSSYEEAVIALEELLGETILEESPGQIYYLSETEYEHDLSAVNLYTTTAAEVLYELDSLYVKNGIFDQLYRDVTFYIDDPDYTEDVLLSFTVAEAQGRLQILLNGETILDDELAEGSPDPLDLSSFNLNDLNTLEFQVNEVGYAFWTTNEYQLDDLMITGDVTDISQQVSQTTFTVSDTEKYNVERARLYYYPDCYPRSVGALTIMVNNDVIYSSIPDCQQINMVEFSPSVLSAGDNHLYFKTDKGEYLIYSISVKTELEEQEYPTYYFEIDEETFIYSEEVDRDRFSKDYECGEADGYCPSGCGEDDDPDCCFEGRNTYWCDSETTDEDYRCTGISESDTSKCDYCPSGYEDDNGYAPDECEDQCGDDHDNYCPDGCSIYYDKDCCFEDDEDNFWCDEVPSYGLGSVCETSLSDDECEQCATGYQTDGSSDVDCDASSSDFVEVYEFFPGYEMYIVFSFVDDEERKNANVYVNGHKFYLDTYEEEYIRQITDYIEPGTNSIQIEPRRTLEIRTVEVIAQESD
jgi:hypothetical protein